MNRIKLLRDENHLNQAELGKILGVTSQAIGLYENEKRRLDTKDASILADFFDVSLDYLMCKTDIRKPEKMDCHYDKIHTNLFAKDYINITDEQLKQIDTFAEYILKDNLKIQPAKKQKKIS